MIVVASVWPQKEWFIWLFFSGKTYQAPHAVKATGAIPRMEES